MKCKDCLNEINEKEYYNKNNEGVCQKCRQRMSQIKYENKKFGKNKKYVPLRLKDKAQRKEGAVEVIKENNKENESTLYTKEIESIVSSDIEKVFEKNSVVIKNNDSMPFTVFMDMFESLLDVKNGYMNNYIKAEDIFNMLERDYQHAFEDAKTISEMNERGQMFKCLLDKRRDVKNVNMQYSRISRVIYEIINKDPSILNKVHIANKALKDLIDQQDSHYYRAEVSEFVQEADFCKGVKPSTKAGTKKYDVSIPVFNFGNNSAGVPYDFHRYAYATNEADAIEQVKLFIAKNFPKVSYKANDFLAVEMYDANDIKKEVCL